MAWRDRRQWDWNEKNEKKNRNQRRASESKDSNSNKNAFPSYDRSSGGGSSSSAPSAVGGPSQEQLYQALLACAAKDQSMASLVENLVPQAVSEDQEIRSQQQSLNRIRKCRQKIVKKEALVKTKKEQWTQFVEDMRRHISSEKSRHTTEVQTLEEEITELKEELAQLRSGQDKTEPDEKMDASLDELLDIDSDDKTKQLQEQLDQAKMEVQEAQNVAYAMQAQMQAFFDYQKLAAGAAVAPTMEGPMVAPNTLPPNGPHTPQRPKPPGLAGVRRDARAPFGIVPKEKTTPRDSPYGRTQPPVIPLDGALNGQDGMD